MQSFSRKITNKQQINKNSICNQYSKIYYGNFQIKWKKGCGEKIVLKLLQNCSIVSYVNCIVMDMMFRTEFQKIANGKSQVYSGCDGFFVDGRHKLIKKIGLFE